LEDKVKYIINNCDEITVFDIDKGIDCLKLYVLFNCNLSFLIFYIILYSNDYLKY